MNTIEHWATVATGKYQHHPSYGMRGELEYLFGRNKGSGAIVIAMVMQKMKADLGDKAKQVKKCSIQADYIVFDSIYGGVIAVKVFSTLHASTKAI